MPWYGIVWATPWDMLQDGCHPVGRSTLNRWDMPQDGYHPVGRSTRWDITYMGRMIYRTDAGYRTGGAIVFERSISRQREACEYPNTAFFGNISSRAIQKCFLSDFSTLIIVEKTGSELTVAPLCDNPHPLGTMGHLVGQHPWGIP